MRTRFLIGLMGVTLCLAGLGGVGAATAPATTPPPAHHGLFGHLRHTGSKTLTGAPVTHSRLRHTGSKTLTGGPAANGRASHHALLGGSIIGNKRTHVYHLAGDKGNMPTEKNRVYFRTAAEAQAAGYHAAGQHTGTKHTTGSMGRHPRSTSLHTHSRVPKG